MVAVIAFAALLIVVSILAGVGYVWLALEGHDESTSWVMRPLKWTAGLCLEMALTLGFEGLLSAFVFVASLIYLAVSWG